jgi:hypothetical protein
MVLGMLTDLLTMFRDVLPIIASSCSSSMR